MIVQKGKNIADDLISADDIEKKWPKWDLLLTLGFGEYVRRNLCRRYWEEQDDISLVEVFEVVISSQKDPRPGYLISPMLNARGVGQKTFLHTVKHITELKFGRKCKRIWNRKYKQFADVHRVKGIGEHSYSFAVTEAGKNMAMFKNGSHYAPRLRGKNSWWS